MTVDELRARIEAIAQSPSFWEMVEQNLDFDVAMLHHAGFETDEELHLLGLMVKVLCLRGKGVLVVPDPPAPVH